MPEDPVADRAIGCLLGLAVGDALGTTLEFARRDAHPPLTDMVGGGRFRLQPGEWTDDTCMALCLADSIIARGGLDQRDLMQRFVRWWREGHNSHNGRCFDIGITTCQALHRFTETGDPVAGSTDPNAAGNGSIMRLAPVALRWANDPEQAVTADRDDIRSSGYVVHTLEAALWCVDRAGDFSEAVLLAANLGDDADTVAAVTGQIAGALWGRHAIPTHWLDRLAWRQDIEQRGRALVTAGFRP